MREVIERLEALLEKATPGPWTAGGSYGPHGAEIVGDNGSRRVCGVPHVERDVFDPDGRRIGTVPLARGVADAALIAEAINALPALLRLARAVEDAPEREVRLCCGHFAVSDDDGTDAEVESLEGQRVRLLPWGGA